MVRDIERLAAHRFQSVLPRVENLRLELAQRRIQELGQRHIGLRHALWGFCLFRYSEGIIFVASSFNDFIEPWRNLSSFAGDQLSISSVGHVLRLDHCEQVP